jgi:histidinol-phosphatase (PHP family)
MEEYVLWAIKNGLEEICFTDHFTPSEKGQRNSMAFDEISLYFQSVQYLKYKYSGNIKVKSGLELDFDEDQLGLYCEITDTYDFDAVICSVHFVGDVNIASRSSKPVMTAVNHRELCDQYFNKLEKMLNYDFFDIIGHIDILKKTGIIQPDLYSNKLKNIIEKIAGTGLTVELNTSGFRYPFRDSFPASDLLKTFHENNVPFTVGSDAHRPSEVGMMVTQSLGLLAKAGYGTVNGFSRRKQEPRPILL